MYVGTNVLSITAVTRTPYRREDHLVGAGLPVVASQKCQQIELPSSQANPSSKEMDLVVDEVDVERACDDRGRN